MKLALLGYGHAGRAFGAMLLQKSAMIRSVYHTDVKITAIATKTKGTLLNPAGIDLAEAEADLVRFGRFSKGVQMEGLRVAEEAEYDALVELTPLDIFSGQPAIDHIKAAFCRGKHVISANKGPIAWAYRSLKEMAREKGCQFLYETTVMDGAPVFNLAEDTLKMCRITEINGILNSTTNFILEALAQGTPYDEAIREGKARGFVEADPSLDVEGWDAAAKVTALMNVLMDADITPMDINRKGIEDITAQDIQEAAREGKVIKLLCNGKMLNGKPVGTVQPAALPQGDLLASITGTSSVVSLTTDLMGTVSIVEHDPGVKETAYGVFGDVLRLMDRRVIFPHLGT